MHTIRTPWILLFILAGIGFTFTGASAYAPGAVTQYSIGGDLLASGNAAGAAAAFGEAIRLEPDYFEAWNGLADARNRDRQFGEALEASNRSLEINPGYVRGWINRGQILYNIGYRYEDVAKDPATADLLYEAQLAAFEKAISLDNSSAEAWFNKAYALGGLKRYNEAIAAFDVVYALDPAYPNLLKNREIAVQLRDLTAAKTPAPVAVTTVTRPFVETPVTGIPTTKAPLPPYLVVFGIAGAALALFRRQ